jgi:hypothetical protein
MVMAMTTMARSHCTERLADASVVTAVVDIAGARHEVLPPRQSDAGGLFVQSIRRDTPP